MKTFLLFTMLISALLPDYATAQSGKIETDQPDQSDGAGIVDKKMLQVESSVYFNSFKGQSTAVISSSLLRYGLSKKVEARLLVEQGYHRDLYISETAHATSPLAIGAKAALLKEQKGWPALVLLGWLQVPATNFKSEPVVWAPALVLILEKHLSDFTLTFNAGPKEEPFAAVWEWESTGDVKYEVNEHVEIFAEYFGQYEAHETPLHNIDGGILYGINKRMQVHLTGGSSILHSPSNFFINTGFAFNFK